MLLDRSIAPDAQAITKINIPALETLYLPNEVPVYLVNTGTQPIVRFEIVFEAGNKYESLTGESYFTTKMLSEGTETQSANQIAEGFAQLGYFTEFTQGAERTVISLNGLTKHLNEALLILKDILDYATFPEKELENLKLITKQNLSISLEKTAYLASKSFKENLFGADHYVGRSMNYTDIDQINHTGIAAFYLENIKNRKYKIFIAGKIGQQEISIISKLFGTEKLLDIKNMPNNEVDKKYEKGISIIEKPNSMQSSLRIGRRIIERSNPDYYNFLVCNTILGGYFGSRLMKNIREDKGYTYGISSQFLPINKYAYFMIGTDVKLEHTKSTIEEIEKEIKILQTESMPEEELEVVKNFLIGDFAGSFNTPFEIVDKHKIIIFEGLKSDFHESFIENISKITPKTILETAQKYLNFESMLKVVVGGI